MGMGLLEMAAPLSGEDYDSYLSQLRIQELRRQSGSAFVVFLRSLVGRPSEDTRNPPITEVMGYV